MTPSEIQSTLQNPSYLAMLDIYKKFKINSKFDDFFASDVEIENTNVKFKMLHKEVSNIYRKIIVNGPVENTRKETPPSIGTGKIELPPKKVRVIIDTNPHISREKLSEDMQELYDSNGKMNQEMKSMHALMAASTNNEESKMFLEKISNLESYLKKNWKVIDKWYEDNITNPQKPAPEVKKDTASLLKEIKANEAYIRRYGNSNRPAAIEKIAKAKQFLHDNGIPLPGTKKNK